MVEFAGAMTAMEEIKRLQRQGAWGILPDRYSALRSALISIKNSHADLSPDHESAIQGAIEQFRTIEKAIERAVAESKAPPKVATVNEIVSVQIEKIAEILGALRTSKNG